MPFESNAVYCVYFFGKNNAVRKENCLSEIFKPATAYSSSYGEW